MKVAIIHYWLVGMRGGERVLEYLCDLYPDADIYTHAFDAKNISDKIKRHRIIETFIGRLPMAKRHYQKYLPLMPRALEALDLTGYDLVISCEAGPAKGVIVRPDAVHVTYCHSPMRYIWDQYHQYGQAGGMVARIMMSLFAPGLRIWDSASAVRSDAIMANSHFVRQRIAKFWGRDATVVYPPIDNSLFHTAAEVSDEYLWVGQFVANKHPDMAVAAFNASGRKLHMIGDGPMLNRLRSVAKPNIRFTQRVDFSALRSAFATCQALIFTSEEDFGLIPIEVMASGRPVVAYARGGALETVVENVTGMFFRTGTANALNATITALETWLPQFQPQAAQARAAHFSLAQFRAGFLDVVEQATKRQSIGG